MKNTIVQFTNANNVPAGLYATDRTDIENFQSVFDLNVAAAAKLAEEEEVDINEHLDDLLHEDGFDRIWAEEVTTDNPEV